MNKALFSLIFLAAMGGLALNGPAAQPLDKSEIRDIRGPQPPDGLPPFVGTGLVLLVAGIGLALTMATRKGRPEFVPQPAISPAGDLLSSLREAYERGELPAVLLCERLAGLLSARLVPEATVAMTNADLLLAASGTASNESLATAAELFDLCDRVRFGDYQPSTSAIAQALTAAQQLLDRLGGVVP